jgi:hypothetical protein
MDVDRAERLLPVLWTALADVAELRRARRHPLPELGREAVERVLWHAERLETAIAQRNGDPRVLRPCRRRPPGVDKRMQPPHQLPAGGAVVDPKQQIPAHVRRRPLVQRATLDIVEFENHGNRFLRRRHSCPREKCSGGLGGSGFAGARYGNARDPGLVA